MYICTWEIIYTEEEEGNLNGVVTACVTDGSRRTGSGTMQPLHIVFVTFLFRFACSFYTYVTSSPGCALGGVQWLPEVGAPLWARATQLSKHPWRPTAGPKYVLTPARNGLIKMSSYLNVTSRKVINNTIFWFLDCGRSWFDCHCKNLKRKCKTVTIGS